MTTEDGAQGTTVECLCSIDYEGVSALPVRYVHHACLAFHTEEAVGYVQDGQKFKTGGEILADLLEAGTHEPTSEEQEQIRCIMKKNAERGGGC